MTFHTPPDALSIALPFTSEATAPAVAALIAIGLAMALAQLVSK